MFGVVRKAAVVPPHAVNLARDIWGQEDDMEAEEGPHAGVGFKEYLEPRDVATQLAELIAHRRPLREVHFADASFAVTDNQYELVTGAREEGGDQFVVLMEGRIENGPELLDLYDVDISDVPPGQDLTGAALVQHLYWSGFSDTEGDSTDQPATVLSAMQGDFAFVLYDAGAGYVLAARSSQGKTHFYWGLDADEHALVFATHRPEAVGRLSDFPRGCFFESQLVEGQGDSTILAFNKPLPSLRTLEASLRVDSHGHLRAMLFKSKSGKLLTEEDADMMDEGPTSKPAAMGAV